MIVCPNCNHQNPDGANQCEACYTPLPSTVACPSCGADIQADASFCGQCGADLRTSAKTPVEPAGQSSSDPEIASASTISSFPSSGSSSDPDSEIKTQNFLSPDSPQMPANPTGDPVISSASTPSESPDFDLPDLVEPDPLLIPEPIGTTSATGAAEPVEIPEISQPISSPEVAQPASQPVSQPVSQSASQPEIPPTPTPIARPAATQLQTVSVRLRHVQTDTPIELPKSLSVVRIGKPNDQTPPDIDVSGFPDSEIVSRTHANLRVEGDVYYVEDVGSSNGTYVNGLPLPAGNRHRLRPGDRVALGKGDKVSFIFEAAS